MPFDMFYKSTPAPKSPSCHQLLFLSYPKSRMDDDWDLHAVVRSCSASSAVISQPPPSSFLGCGVSEPCFRISSQPREELRDLCVPFVSNWREAQEEDGLLKPLPQPLFSKQKPARFSGGAKSDSLKNSARKCKKKRSLMKKQICRVDAEKLSSDGWNWRKYGQKPIKGSPFPRGYYRCSSSKACVARKQVERDRSDPDMFLVTYTSEHNHPPPFDRNSFQTTARATPKPDLEKTEAHDKQMDKDEGDSVISDMAPDDCFFMSMEDPS